MEEELLIFGEPSFMFLAKVLQLHFRATNNFLASARKLPVSPH